MSEHAAEIAALRTKLQFYVDNGRSDSVAAAALRVRMNELEAFAREHAETVARERAERTAREKARSEGGARWASQVGDAKTVRETYGTKA